MIKLFAAVSLQMPEDNTLHPLHALVPASCPQWGRILVPGLALLAAAARGAAGTGLVQCWVRHGAALTHPPQHIAGSSVHGVRGTGGGRFGIRLFGEKCPIYLLFNAMPDELRVSST